MRLVKTLCPSVLLSENISEKCFLQLHLQYLAIESVNACGGL